MIKAVVFDIGGVLEIVDDDRWQDEWIARCEARAGVAPGLLDSVPRRTDRSEAGLRAWLEVHLGSDVDFFMRDFWDSYCGRLDVELRDFILSLTVRVAALSNSADGARREEQERYGLGDLFETIVYSHEEGVEKPDPAIYRIMEQRLGLAGDEILFLDDRQSAVDGALAVGWRAVLHRSTRASITSLSALL